MIRLRLCALLLCIVAAPMGVWAQADAVSPPADWLDGPLTIDVAVETALAHHPSVISSQANMESAAGSVQQARSDLRPSVGLSADYTHSAAGSGSGQHSTTLSVDQLLYDSGRTRDGIRESRLSAEAAAHRLDQTRDDVADDARQAFLALMTAQELLEVAQYSVRLQTDTLDMVQTEYDTGTVPGADVAKAAAALAAARSDVTVAENDVAQARVTLSQAMGIDVRTDYDVAMPPQPEMPELALDGLLEAAYTTRPELQAARLDVRAAEAALASARKGLKPSVSGSGSYGARESGFPAVDGDWSVGLSFGVTVSDGGATRGRTRQAKAQLTSAESAEYDTAQQVAAEVVGAQLDLQTAIERIVAAEASVVSAAQDHDLAVGRYQANVGILLEVLDAETNLTSAQADLAEARYSLLSAYHALGRAIGAPLDGLQPAADTDVEPAPATDDDA